MINNEIIVLLSLFIIVLWWTMKITEMQFIPCDSSPIFLWSHLWSLHAPVHWGNHNCPFPFTLLLWKTHADFLEGEHQNDSTILYRPLRCLWFWDWTLATHSWQVCLWVPFDFCNWSIMQLHELCSTFLNCPTLPHCYSPSIGFL